MILKTVENGQDHPKRRLEDQLGMQYTVITEGAEFEEILGGYYSFQSQWPRKLKSVK